jgi:hypothetical protein
VATLTQLMDVLAGGPGSGCHGPNCGRPHTKAETEGLKKELKEVRDRLGVKRGQKGYARKHNRANLKILKEGLKRRIQYGKRREKILPGMKWKKGKITIPVKPAWKGRVKQSFKTAEGHQVTVVKPRKLQDREGKTWLRKPSEFKGKFVKTHDEFNVMGKLERNVLFQAIRGDKGQAVQISRDYGNKAVFVKEAALLSHVGTHDNIIRTRQVKFKNFGQAFGFLKMRYGISFKLKSRE